jgi:hypothetical protein
MFCKLLLKSRPIASFDMPIHLEFLIHPVETDQGEIHQIEE